MGTENEQGEGTESQGEGTEHTHDEGTEIPAAQEDRIVDKVLSEIKKIVGPEPKSGNPGGDAPAVVGSGPAATEADMERRVREEVDRKITANEKRTAAAEARAAHEAEHEKLRAAVERPPRTFSRLTTALWGGDDS